MDQKFPTHPILAEIETYCASRSMGASKFGALAINDPSLVTDIRHGRDIGHRLATEIRQFMLTGVGRVSKKRKLRRKSK